MSHDFEQVGPYLVDEELGRGTMGVVYRARHELTRKDVALKVLFPQVAGTNVGTERFRREVRVSSMVDSAGVAEVYTAGKHDGMLYYAMELLDGRELDRALGGCSPREGIRLFCDVTETLASCHEAGIVHRDLKPENVFVVETSSGTSTKLLDFGIAAVRSAPSATQTGFTMGTPTYMSPEQARSAKNTSPASDVWSIGVMLYDFVTGDLPFDGETSTNVLVAVVNSEPEPAEPRFEVPGDLLRVTERCLRKDPDERYADGAQLHEALQQIEWTERSSTGAVHLSAGGERDASNAASDDTSADEAESAGAPNESDTPNRGVGGRVGLGAWIREYGQSTIAVALVGCAIVAATAGIVAYLRTDHAPEADARQTERSDDTDRRENARRLRRAGNRARRNARKILALARADAAISGTLEGARRRTEEVAPAPKPPPPTAETTESPAGPTAADEARTSADAPSDTAAEPTPSTPTEPKEKPASTSGARSPSASAPPPETSPADTDAGTPSPESATKSALDDSTPTEDDAASTTSSKRPELAEPSAEREREASGTPPTPAPSSEREKSRGEPSRNDDSDSQNAADKPKFFEF